MPKVSLSFILIILSSFLMFLIYYQNSFTPAITSHFSKYLNCDINLIKLSLIEHISRNVVRISRKLCFYLYILLLFEAQVFLFKHIFHIIILQVYVSFVQYTSKTSILQHAKFNSGIACSTFAMMEQLIIGYVPYKLWTLTLTFNYYCLIFLAHQYSSCFLCYI